MYIHLLCFNINTGLNGETSEENEVVQSQNIYMDYFNSSFYQLIFIRNAQFYFNKSIPQ